MIFFLFHRPRRYAIRKVQWGEGKARGAWFFFPYHPSLPGLTPPPPPPPPPHPVWFPPPGAAPVIFQPLKKNSRGFFSLPGAEEFLNWIGRWCRFKLAKVWVFPPAPVLVYIRSGLSKAGTGGPSRLDHTTALRKLHLFFRSEIFFVFFLSFFLAFMFWHWFQFLIEWRVARHRANCKILFFPRQKAVRLSIHEIRNA